jgi:Flp pilus assembly protein TadD
LNSTYRVWHAWSVFKLGRRDEAESMMVEVARLEPTLPMPHLNLGIFLLVRGRPEEALLEAEWVTIPYARLTLSAAAYHALGRKAKSDKALGELVENLPGSAAYQIAIIYAFRGEADRAFQWLERAREQGDAGLMYLRGDPLLEKIRGDARYTTFLRKMHLAR